MGVAIQIRPTPHDLATGVDTGCRCESCAWIINGRVGAIGMAQKAVRGTTGIFVYTDDLPGCIDAKRIRKVCPGDIELCKLKGLRKRDRAESERKQDEFE